jgi:hypothetical protein
MDRIRDPRHAAQCRVHIVQILSIVIRDNVDPKQRGERKGAGGRGKARERESSFGCRRIRSASSSVSVTIARIVALLTVESQSRSRQSDEITLGLPCSRDLQFTRGTRLDFRFGVAGLQTGKRAISSIKSL